MRWSPTLSCSDTADGCRAENAIDGSFKIDREDTYSHIKEVSATKGVDSKLYRNSYMRKCAVSDN